MRMQKGTKPIKKNATNMITSRIPIVVLLLELEESDELEEPSLICAVAEGGAAAESSNRIRKGRALCAAGAPEQIERLGFTNAMAGESNGCTRVRFLFEVQSALSVLLYREEKCGVGSSWFTDLGKKGRT